MVSDEGREENRGRQNPETCAQETGRQTHRQKRRHEECRGREEIGKKEENKDMREQERKAGRSSLRAIG